MEKISQCNKNFKKLVLYGLRCICILNVYTYIELRKKTELNTSK